MLGAWEVGLKMVVWQTLQSFLYANQLKEVTEKQKNKDSHRRHSQTTPKNTKYISCKDAQLNRKIDIT